MFIRGGHKVNKLSFNKLALEDQVKYFNTKLKSGKNISQICKSINISYSTIRDRFKRNNYVYSRIINQYENINNIINLEISDELINKIMMKLNTKLSTLECEKRNSNLTSRSFRIHSCILNEFIDFCNSSTFTQQEILSQFIADGLNKYKKQE